MTHPEATLHAPHPRLGLLARHDRRVIAGHPWAYSNELAWVPAMRAMAPGTLVRLDAASGAALGTFMFNPRSLIAARALSPDPAAVIDQAFLAARLAAAAALRARLFDAPYFRLCHAEADRLPGLVVDRFGSVLVAQLNAAGMDRLREPLLAALAETCAAEAIVLRNDSSARALEGLSQSVEVASGALPERVVVEEGGVVFPIDVLGGQKTGWFHDQRFNRDAVAALASGARVLDCYCHTGAFGLRAAFAGAESVVLADRSEHALAIAEDTAARNGLASRVTTRRSEAFALLEALLGAGERFDVVVCDPPAFAKSRKDHGAAMKGYSKLARLAAGLVAPGGFLFLASCSHAVSAGEFADCVVFGLHRAQRTGRLLRSSGAGPDHPLHPLLPESAYLKAMLLQLD